MVEQDQLKKDAETLAEWLKTDEELPKEIEHILLKRYIQSCHNDVEKAKEFLRFSFDLRSQHEQIFLNRDPLSSKTQENFKILDTMFLPNTTKENYKIVFNRLADSDSSKFDCTETVKTFFMLYDVRLMSADQLVEEITNGDIAIFDMNEFSVWHLTKMIFTIKMLLKYTQQAIPILIQQVHLINCSPLIEMLMPILKSFINPEVSKLIHIHLPNSKTLYEYVDQDLLPSEYGGKVGSMIDIKNFWIQEIQSKRDYLKDIKNWEFKPKVPRKHFLNVNMCFMDMTQLY